MSEPFDRNAAIEAYLRHAGRGSGDEEFFWRWEAVSEFAANSCDRSIARTTSALYSMDELKIGR